MGSLQGRLAAREAACRARVERLRAEIAELSERLAAEQERLSRLAITRETVEEVLSGPDLPEDIEFAAAAAGADNVAGAAQDDDEGDGDVAVRAALRARLLGPGSSGSSAGVLVPRWRQGAGAGELIELFEGLPEAYRGVLGVLAAHTSALRGPSARAGLRAKHICQELGLGSEPRHVEGLRSKLKRLVERGWLREVEAGRFALAEGVAVPAGPGEHGAG